jgi:hypothetical protein
MDLEHFLHWLYFEPTHQLSSHAVSISLVSRQPWDRIQRTYDGGWDSSAQSNESESEQVKVSQAMYGSRAMSALSTLGAHSPWPCQIRRLCKSYTWPVRHDPSVDRTDIRRGWAHLWALVDGVQVHKVVTVSQSKSGNVWIYSTVYTGYTWSPPT